MSDAAGRRDLRTGIAQAVVLGMLVLSPIEVDRISIEPPPAAVLPVGDPMPSLDARRAARPRS